MRTRHNQDFNQQNHIFGGVYDANRFTELPPVLNVKDVHAFLGIPQSSVYDLFHRADFPTLHVNSRLLVLKADLLEWMKRHINDNSIIFTDSTFSGVGAIQSRRAE